MSDESKEMTEEEFEKGVEHSREVYKKVKKNLKLRSKGQLIDIAIHYASELEELRYVAKMLLEENKQLKGEDNEEA